ncbi:MAG: flagellar filament capping protein FliD, partial [Desulfobacterales bacterium]|nr:flagellar filament capping protein FliD [Desulfobacterales bacterium]
SLSSNYLGRTTTVSDTEVATASAADGTDTGSYQMDVNRLASSSAYISEGFSSETDTVYVPTSQESTDGFSDTDIVLAEGETLEISYGPEDDPETFTITGTAGGMTAVELADAINADTANQDDEGNSLVTASTYIDDEDGTTHIRIEATDGGTGEDSRVSVTGSDDVTGFSAPTMEFSFKLGDGDLYTISVPAESTLEDLAERINEDEDNPGVSVSVIDTGTGDNPYQLMLEADDSGEDNRITVVTEPPGLTLTEENGSGYTMTGDTAISFDSAVTIDAANDTIIFQEDDGDGYGTELTATIEEGSYDTEEELAEAVEIALENESKLNGANKDYQVDIDPDTGKMTINEAGTLEALSVNWGDDASPAAATLGFSETMTVTPHESSLNSEVTVEGVTYQRQENQTLTDVIDGVTLNLYDTGTTTISIENNTESLEADIISLVEMYNTLITEIDENDDYDEDTEAWGTLALSSTASALEQALPDLFSTVVDTGGSVTSIMDLGVELESDGTLTLDEDILSQQLEENYDDVVDMLLGTDTETGLGDILNDAFGDYALSDGYISGEIDAIESTIDRLETDYEEEMERIDKKYEIMAEEYTELDSYLAELESIQDYIASLSSDSDD